MKIEKLAKLLTSIAAVWGLFIATVSGVVAYYHDCQECFLMYKIELSILLITMASIFTVYVILNRKVEWLTNAVNKGLSTVQSQQVKSEVDRLYTGLKGKDALTADEYKYLEHLKQQMTELGINSFTERKISYLMAKDING